MESITHVALRVGEGIWAIKGPARHKQALWLLGQFALESDAFLPASKVEYGFLTSTGRFVDRYMAGKIAFRAGQVSKFFHELTSEHVWPKVVEDNNL